MRAPRWLRINRIAERCQDGIEAAKHALDVELEDHRRLMSQDWDTPDPVAQIPRPPANDETVVIRTSSRHDAIVGVVERFTARGARARTMDHEWVAAVLDTAHGLGHIHWDDDVRGMVRTAAGTSPGGRQMAAARRLLAALAATPQTPEVRAAILDLATGLDHPEQAS